MASCSKEIEKPEVALVEDSQTEQLQVINDFIHLMNAADEEVSTRTVTYYTPVQANYLVEAGLNKEFSYPWHDHVDLSFKSDEFTVPIDSKGKIDDRGVELLYDYIENFIACHVADISNSNRESRVVDVEIESINSSNVTFTFTSVVGLLVNNAPASLSFGTNEEYHAFYGNCAQTTTDRVTEKFSDYITFNLNPPVLVASTDAYVVVNVTSIGLPDASNQYGWRDVNTADITQGDFLKDYKVWYVNCDNNDPNIPDCDFIGIDGESVGNHAQIFCQKNTTGNDAELNFYLGNMESSVNQLIASTTKTYISTKVDATSYLSISYDVYSGFYYSENFFGDKIYNNDPKSMLTCAP